MKVMGSSKQYISRKRNERETREAREKSLHWHYRIASPRRNLPICLRLFSPIIHLKHMVFESESGWRRKYFWFWGCHIFHPSACFAGFLFIYIFIYLFTTAPQKLAQLKVEFLSLCGLSSGTNLIPNLQTHQFSGTLLSVKVAAGKPMLLENSIQKNSYIFILFFVAGCL